MVIGRIFAAFFQSVGRSLPIIRALFISPGIVAHVCLRFLLEASQADVSDGIYFGGLCFVPSIHYWF